MCSTPQFATGILYAYESYVEGPASAAQSKDIAMSPKALGTVAWTVACLLIRLIIQKLGRRSNVVTATYFIGILITVAAPVFILASFIIGHDTEVYYLYYLSWLYGGCQLMVSSRLGAFSVTIDLLALLTAPIGNHVFRRLHWTPFRVRAILIFAIVFHTAITLCMKCELIFDVE
ncbi:hypothetical protein B9Z55_013433 [Caenorhabditis nigoni]|nr:hypothetical protein B9Z55_013433 [Caenorhabditis nigoni]